MSTNLKGMLVIKLFKKISSQKFLQEPNWLQQSRSLRTTIRQKQQLQERGPEVNDKVDPQQPISHYDSISADKKFTSKLDFIEPAKYESIPMYHVLDQDGSLIGDIHESLTLGKILELYKGMLMLNTMDSVMFDSHRQGRISFYMTSFGEEALQFGSGGALEMEDWIYAQYRESGLLLHRRMPLKQMLAQCYGNKEDLGKGRQMPIHYGNKQLNYVTISSPLTTQLPQAVGTAYSFKLDFVDKKRIVICYFGEGAASEGDAHAAMNFASTLDCPVIFFCRNNQYAISTPTKEQYRSDGIATRAIGYGMSSIRVDGNDLFAVYNATKQARQICVEQSRPVLIEAMSYRAGHHSTSDDSLAYRDANEVKLHKQNDPIQRVYNYLLTKNAWSDKEDKEARKAARNHVIEALNWAEKVKKLPVSSMFEDVYDEMPNHLLEQCEELRKHLEVYGQHYPIDEHT